MLVLCIHTVSNATAKVPFSMMILLDHVRKRDLPPELKCRQVFPTSGLRSTSLWDTTDIETLQLWLDEFLDADCTNSLYEIQEEFAFGISAELTRLRTAEKVTERTQRAAAAASQQVTELDAKYRVSEQASMALKAAREASKAAGSRVATGLGTLQARAMENNRVAAAATSLSAGWSRLSNQVPGLFARSPAGSDHGSPGVGASAAQPSSSASTTAAAPDAAASAALPVAGHSQLKKREESPASHQQPASAPVPAPAQAQASQASLPPKPAGTKQQADGKGALFTLDDAEV